MSSIILIPAFISAYIAFTQSPHRAFLNVFIPVLLFIPPYYVFKIQGLPDPNFYEATIAPIAFVFFLRGMPGWRFSWTDVFVFVFAFSISFSEYLNFGYKEAQNLMANMVLSVFFPYLLAKSLIEPAGLRVELAKRIVLMLFIVAIFLVYENHFRTGYTLWQKAFGPFFGGGWSRAIRFRWGMVRANGPFVHPIQAGIIIAIGFRLQQWLQWNNAWPSQIKGLPKLPILTVPQILTLGLAAGVFAPLSRAPWLGSILAAMSIFGLVAIVSLAKKPATRYLIICGLLVSLVILSLSFVKVAEEFASIGREEAGEQSDERRTIAYRFELYITYGEIVLDQWMWGWGRLGWPKDSKQSSIDNAYLLLALNHGLIAVGCFFALFFFLGIRLFIHIMHNPAAQPPKAALDITLFSLLLIEIFCLATVSLNTTNMTLLFILFGWIDGYLLNRQPEKIGIQQTASNHKKLPFQFRRVM
jgi:predicted membrane protein